MVKWNIDCTVHLSWPERTVSRMSLQLLPRLAVSHRGRFPWQSGVPIKSQACYLGKCSAPTTCCSLPATLTLLPMPIPAPVISIGEPWESPLWNTHCVSFLGIPSKHPLRRRTSPPVPWQWNKSHCGAFAASAAAGWCSGFLLNRGWSIKIDTGIYWRLEPVEVLQI